jgi:hypothetical protein
MPKLLVLANLELSLDLPPGADTDAWSRMTERRLMRALRDLARADGRAEGTVQTLEVEAFGYADAAALEAEPATYYYNKREAQENR